MSETAAKTTGRALSRPGPKLTARAAGLLIALALLGMVALVPARALLAQRSTMADLERQTTQLTQENAALRDQIAHLNDPAELERLARECLGMVDPGEIALVAPDSSENRADC
jgi:cell division protein FtsB